LLAKTATVMLPVVLLIIAWWRNGRIGWRDLARTAPLFALSLAMGLVTLWFQHEVAIGPVVVRDDSFLSRLATAGWAVWFYLGKALVPVNIAFQYPRWNVLAQGAMAFGPLILLAVLFGVLWWKRKSSARHVLAALAAYVALLLPILGFLNIFFMRYSLVSDHWQYPAIPCVLALVVAAVSRLRISRNALVGIAVVIFGVLQGYSMNLAVHYRSAESIWQHTIKHNPDSWLAHANLGEIYLERAKQDQTYSQRAIEHLQKVVDLQPKRSLGYTNLGNALLRAGRLEEAKAAYAAGLALNEGAPSDRASGHVNLGQLLAKSGKPREAEEHFRAAIRLQPKFEQAHLFLGVVLLNDRPAEARTSFFRAAELAPRLVLPRLFLAQMELRSGNHCEARRWAEEVLAIEPQNAEGRDIMARIAAAPATRP
jgi:tetratricopeptide (TPR) repeat protein